MHKFEEMRTMHSKIHGLPENKTLALKNTWVARKQNFGKPFKIWSSTHFYNVNTTWCKNKNKKPLPHSTIAVLGDTQHHDRSTLTIPP